jgi:RNA recognition motif-containing protein
MGNKLYVGNLPYSVNDESLGQMFAQFGGVQSAKVIIDRQSGRSKGFGFVEMASDDQARAAADQMNGKDCDGRALVVNEARPMTPREDVGFGSGGRGRGGDRGDRGDRGGRSFGRR